MSIENPLWGAPRIHGELLKLGFETAQSSVAKYMVKRGGPPSQGWRTFLRNHAPDIAAMDLFVVPTIGFDLLYAIVVVRLDRRDLVWVNVTTSPTAEWIARQLTEAFPWNEAPHYIIRDRDFIYGAVVKSRLRAMGIRDKPTALASPWQNGFAERLIGSIRRECADHFIILGEAHLRRILRAYARYYNDIRTHWSLAKDAPVSRPIQWTDHRFTRNPRWASSPLRPGLGFRYTQPVSRFVQRTESSVHARSLAAFITTMFGFRFSVHTGNQTIAQISTNLCRNKGNSSRRSILVGENIEIWRVKLRSLARLGNLLPSRIGIVRAHPFGEAGGVRS